MIGELIDGGIDTVVEMGTAFSASSSEIASSTATQNDFQNGTSVIREANYSPKSQGIRDALDRQRGGPMPT